jgi:hypothetical protein
MEEIKAFLPEKNLHFYWKGCIYLGSLDDEKANGREPKTG